MSFVTLVRIRLGGGGGRFGADQLQRHALGRNAAAVWHLMTPPDCKLNTVWNRLGVRIRRALLSAIGSRREFVLVSPSCHEHPALWTDVGLFSQFGAVFAFPLPRSIVALCPHWLLSDVC